MSEAGGTSSAPASTQDDIIVALEHAELVRDTLRRCGVTEPDVTDSKPLGLTRLTIRNIATVATTLRKKLPKLLAEDLGLGAKQSGPAYQPPAEPEPVDHVLHYLRRYFEEGQAGWSPTMGKNRFLGPVEQAANSTNGGTISYGGGPDPERAIEPLQRRTERGGSGVTVAALDTAIVAHPWLAGGYSARPDDVLEYAKASGQGSSRRSAPGHATFVTGLILGQAPGSTVLLRQVLGKNPVAGGTATQNSGATSWDVAEAIVEMGRTGAALLNLSLVCYTVDGKPPLVLKTAVDRLPGDTLVIACAGNHGDPRLGITDEDHRKPAWPAALDNVVAVGSAIRTRGKAGARYELSSFTPPGTAWIDVLTSGEKLTSTYVKDRPFNGWAVWGGTSFSAARVSGRIAREMADHDVSAHEAYHRLNDAFAKSAGPKHRPRPVFWAL